MKYFRGLGEKLLGKREVPSGQPTQPGELVSYIPETVEYTFPFLKIPNGYPVDDTVHTVLDSENEPSEEELRTFFTADIIQQRILYCPAININLLDDLNAFGKEPGYIFVTDVRYEGARRLNDDLALHAFTGQQWVTASGLKVGTVEDYDFFPRDKYGSQIITKSRTPRTYWFLRKLLDNVKQGDFSTYNIDELYYALKLARGGSTADTILLEDAQRERRFADKLTQELAQANQFDLKEQRAHHIEMQRLFEESYRRQEQAVPRNVEKYLQLVREFSLRDGISNPSVLKLRPSIEREEAIISAGIEQAREMGDLELADRIARLRDETLSYRRNLIHAPKDEEGHLIE